MFLPVQDKIARRVTIRSESDQKQMVSRWVQVGITSEPRRNHVGTKSEPSRNQVGTKSEQGQNHVGTKSEPKRN